MTARVVQILILKKKGGIAFHIESAWRLLENTITNDAEIIHNLVNHCWRILVLIWKYEIPSWPWKLTISIFLCNQIIFIFPSECLPPNCKQTFWSTWIFKGVFSRIHKGPLNWYSLFSNFKTFPLLISMCFTWIGTQT